MTIQTVNLGTAPTGAGGDTFRSTGAKMNENFTNNTHAASRYVGTAAGNVMEVGAFGLGNTRNSNLDESTTGFFHDASGAAANVGMGYRAVVNICHNYDPANYRWQMGIALGDTSLYGLSARIMAAGVWSNPVRILNGANTTVDANGFIKSASPVVKLFADKIELNDEAAEQNITFEKLDVGHYLLKGTSGFATEGWYIETPKDANGNILFAVIYQQLENKHIEIKTFKKKFDVESASIIADLDNPVDISTGRWIDIRLQEIPKPVPAIPVVTKNDPE
ncbi:putative tail fiber [Acinetobacter baumannii]|uniref:phage tail fiber protein n=1 Tax=Acinetobacter baumannii TaxID=470 RepID=UPI000DE703E6|nr:hypothetical protein [Acinetobacter baumannii]SSQ26960.1 putative tail fiber [Acinetobacter baumannii]